MSRFLFSILFCGFNLFACAQISDEQLLSAIRHDNFDIIEDFFIQRNDPNRLYGKKHVPLLHYAATIDKTKAIEIILKAGADINLLYYNETPLMVAAWYGKENAARLLIQKGAKVNFQNSKGKTASIYCCQTNKPGVLKILVENGADLSMRDCTENAPIDYAYKLQNIDSYAYLTEVTDSYYEIKKIPSYLDGPYVFWQGKSKLKISYLQSDSLKNVCNRIDTLISIGNQPIIINKKGQTFGIVLQNAKKAERQSDIYSNVKRILAIGDLHGGFDNFARFLLNNKVIDSAYRWTFGDGHLVVMGDIFDRGNKVTECIWLLYKLEAEAELCKGKVHFILGNHELMELSGDKKYLSGKYIDLFNRLRLNYSSFYSDDSELGRWLRTRNAVEKINDLVFVHGGISPELAQKDLDIPTINKKIREILNREVPVPSGEIEEFLVGSEGPLWYRGYIKLDQNYYKTTGEKYTFNEEKLDFVLKAYNASTIVFANTNVNNIMSFYNNKLIGIDIPFTLPGIQLQGLYYQDKIFYRMYEDGSSEVLK